MAGLLVFFLLSSGSVVSAGARPWLPESLWTARSTLSTDQSPTEQVRDRRIEGAVLDGLGLPVQGARITVTLRQGSFRETTVSSVDRFRFDALTAGLYDVRVDAAGFEPQLHTVDLRNEAAAVLNIRLEPAVVVEQVVVTVTRTEQRLGNLPASVSVLSGEEIKQSPAVVADDVLRQIPTFSLFRRTSSLSSHPTAQGVSLRGVGPSGVSRTLVLLDDVPFNDPFGGWVYWSRVPLEDTERIEVVDGSSSSLYGNYAMGGVINIVTRRPGGRSLEIKSQYGSRNSPKLDVFGGAAWGKLGVLADGSVFNTDGFPIVAATERGRVDNNATDNFRNVNVKVEYNPMPDVRAFFRGSYFRENRNNGKVSTIDGAEEANDTTWKSASGGVLARLPDLSDLRASIFTDFETFHSNFLAVPTANPPRSVGRMTLNQTVPAKSVGGMVQWSKAIANRQFFTAGTDWRWVRGDSVEDGLDAATGTQVTLHRVSGGTQRSVGVFVQDMIAPTERLEVTLNARLDHWRNYDAHNLETTVTTGLPTANNNPALPDSRGTVVNPRAAAIYHFTDWLSAWGDVGWGFRAPTLNELYRQFRVGNVLTLANSQLGPERLVGGEAGINVALAHNVTWRTTWFDNRVGNPVSNVTVGATPAQVTQQRQNLGRTHIWGVQTDVDYRLGSRWRLSAGYLYDVAKVTEFAANPALVGAYLPQVPKHRGSAQLVYSNPRYATVAVAVQFTGRQFDNDQNDRAVPGYAYPGLPKFTVADLAASRAIGRKFEVFVGLQNLFDKVYYVGTLPTTIGSPRFVNGGIRLRVTGR